MGYNRPMQETSLLNVYNPQQVLAESLLQNIPNWRTVVQALPPQGCLLVTRLDNQQFNPEINRLAQLLTVQGHPVYVVSVDSTPPDTD